MRSWVQPASFGLTVAEAQFFFDADVNADADGAGERAESLRSASHEAYSLFEQACEARGWPREELWLRAGDAPSVDNAAYMSWWLAAVLPVETYPQSGHLRRKWFLSQNTAHRLQEQASWLRSLLAGADRKPQG